MIPSVLSAICRIFWLDAFESTLQEIQEADLLIEVIDASDPQWEIQHEIVTQTLRRRHALSIERLTVYNKADQIPQWERQDGILLSCLTGQGMDALIGELLVRLNLSASLSPEIGDEFSAQVGYNEDERGE